MDNFSKHSDPPVSQQQTDPVRRRAQEFEQKQKEVQEQRNNSSKHLDPVSQQQTGHVRRRAQEFEKVQEQRNNSSKHLDPVSQQQTGHVRRLFTGRYVTERG